MNSAESCQTERQTQPGARPSVCFITVEFHGLFRNGGIGTANTGLALALAGQGFDVTVAIANADAGGPRLEIGDFATLKDHYAALGVRLDYVPPCAGIPRAFDDPQLASWSVYQYVRDRPFGVVLFNDNGGQGYYTLLAKRLGIFKPAPRLIVVAHGPLDWVSEINAQEYNYQGLPVAFMEARGAALADTLVSPSRYLLDWMSARGWIAPGQGTVVQNIIGTSPRDTPPEPRPVRELVFFGRQEIRKGIDIFCEALDGLVARGLDLSAVRVTFLGKFSRAGPLHSGVYIGERARRWPMPVRILTEYGQAEALDYLCAPGRLAVIPSRAENSPCVVAECLLQGILFLAADRGGTAELVAEADRASCLFEPEALASRLADCLVNGHRPARLAAPQETVLAQWVDLLVAPPAQPTKSIAVAPEVSVCLAGDASPEFAACLAALQAQQAPPLEILVAPVTPMPAPAGVVLVPGIHPSRAAARNAAADYAQGSHLLFMEEVNAVLAPEGLAILLAAARGGADILTCMSAPALDGQGGLPAIPLGGCLERGLEMNCFGEGAFLVKRTAFGADLPADGPDHAASWRFLARAVAADAVVELVPAPLVELRHATALGDGEALVAAQRALFTDLAALPLGRFARFMECAARVAQRRQNWLETLTGELDDSVSEAVRQLRRIAPNGAQARKFFLAYCADAGLTELARDYALHSGAAAAPLPAPLPPPPLPACTMPAGAAALPLAEAVEKPLRLPIALLEQADVLTDAAGLDFAVFDPGPPALLHPVAGRLSVARIPRMLQPGFAALHCLVSLGHERAHPVEFALWAYPAGTGPDEPELPADEVPCSPWLRVEVAHVRQELRLTLPEPCVEPLDIYLATRVPEQPNAYFCHALWHEFAAWTQRQDDGERVLTGDDATADLPG